MKERGIITRLISEKRAEVAIKKSEACAKCGACRDVGEEMAAIEAANEIGAKQGDEVEIEIPSLQIFKGSIIVFLIPIFFLIAGYLIGAAFMRLLGMPDWEEAFGVVCSLIFLGFSYLAIRWYDINIQRKDALCAKIIKVITSP
jgi:sigma-E factor negative regulatory protein RseC